MKASALKPIPYIPKTATTRIRKQIIAVFTVPLQPEMNCATDLDFQSYSHRVTANASRTIQSPDEIGLDFQKDTYDGGLHLNLSGAVKFSVYFANILSENHSVTDYRDNEAVADLYNDKLTQYDKAVLEGKGDIQ